MSALPIRLEQITADWLGAALSVQFPGTRVSQLSIDTPLGGTATKVFLHVTYSSRPDDGPPQALCLKGGFDDAMRAVAGLGYCIESRFYRDIAPQLGDAVPRAWYAAEDVANQQGLVITDDLRDQGARFGQPEDRYDVDQIAAALERMADWHGRSWVRSGLGRFDWLSVGSPLFRPVVDSFLVPAHWDRFMAMEQTRSFNDALRDRARVTQAVRRLWAVDDRGPLCLAHGDPHPRNTYTLADGALRFLDWQTTCLAPWADDVAYFLVGILDIEQRQRHETDLLRHYLSSLAGAGGPRLRFDDAWTDYRRHHLHGLMFALCPAEMQPAEVCRLMGDRYATAAIDHDTLKLMMLS